MVPNDGAHWPCYLHRVVDIYNKTIRQDALPDGDTAAQQLKAYYQEITGKKSLASMTCTYLGEFLVSRAQIECLLKLRREYLMTWRDSLAHHNDPIEGYFLERLWGTLFTQAVAE